MSTTLAQIVVDAKIQSLALIGLAKNVGKTTTTNHLLETLIGKKHYRSDELALTSLGLDGEAVDALTGLPKPRYVPQAGVLIATTEELLLQARNEGLHVEWLHQLSGSTALGPVILARVLRPGHVIIAGPTLLNDLHSAIVELGRLGAKLSIVDGAINRVGAAAPIITDACIVCTGASAAATPELVARRTAEIVRRLSIQRTSLKASYDKLAMPFRLYKCVIEDDRLTITGFDGKHTPNNESEWIIKHIGASAKSFFILRGALTDELSSAVLSAVHKAQLISFDAELVVEDATRIFCHSAILQRLHDRGLEIRVLNPMRILALTTNPFTPEYPCSSHYLVESLAKTMPEPFPPIIDVVSGYQYP